MTPDAVRAPRIATPSEPAASATSDAGGRKLPPTAMATPARIAADVPQPIVSKTRAARAEPRPLAPANATDAPATAPARPTSATIALIGLRCSAPAGGRANKNVTAAMQSPSSTEPMWSKRSALGPMWSLRRDTTVGTVLARMPTLTSIHGQNASTRRSSAASKQASEQMTAAAMNSVSSSSPSTRRAPSAAKSAAISPRSLTGRPASPGLVELWSALLGDALLVPGWVGAGSSTPEDIASLIGTAPRVVL